MILNCLVQRALAKNSAGGGSFRLFRRRFFTVLQCSYLRRNLELFYEECYTKILKMTASTPPSYNGISYLNLLLFILFIFKLQTISSSHSDSVDRIRCSGSFNQCIDFVGWIQDRSKYFLLFS